MTDNISSSPVADTLLVAYLDNELSAEQQHAFERRLQQDPQLASRLAYLQQSQFDFAAAFEPLLEQAPLAELQAALDKQTEKSLPHQSNNSVSRRSLLAAAVSFLVIGTGVGRYVLAPAPDKQDNNWRSLVAQYMSLYSADTLADIPDSPLQQQVELDRVAKAVGIGLTPQQLQLKGAQLKNARILRYDEYNIAQISWLDEKYGPLALCITRSDHSKNIQQTAEVRQGMNVVYWRRQGFNFMLIGHAPAADIQQQGIHLLKTIS